MLQSVRCIRNQKLQIWLLSWTPAFPKWSQALKIQVGFGSWWSKCCSRTNQLGIPKCRYASEPRPLLFRSGTKACISRLDLGACDQNAAAEQIVQKATGADMAHDLKPYFSNVLPKLRFPSRVGGLVVNMLRKSMSVSNSKVPIWLLACTLTFPIQSQSFTFQVGFWELVVGMLQSIRPIRNPKVVIWILALTLTFRKCTTSLKLQVRFGS